LSKLCVYFLPLNILQ